MTVADCAHGSAQVTGFQPAPPARQERIASPARPLPRPPGELTGRIERLGPVTRPGRPGLTGPAALLPLADCAAVTAAVAAGGRLDWATAGFAAAMLTVLAACGQHRLRICLRVSDQVGRILVAAALPLLAVLPWLPGWDAARLALTCAVLVTAVRAALYVALRAAHLRGRLTEPALVVGTGTVGRQIASLLREHPELGLRPCGFLAGAEAPAGGGGDWPGTGWLPVLGGFADLAGVVSRWRIRRVIVSFTAGRDEDLVTVLRASRHVRADVCVVPRLYELGAALPKASLDEIWGIPLIPLRAGLHAPAARLFKRAFDMIGAAVLLIAVAPVLAVLTAAIRLRSGHPAIFRQVRVTSAGRLATILKLRTLSEHADPDTRWEVPTQRCSRLGGWLRTTHLDELPQLLNVLRGEMSLVGPRPERPYFAGKFAGELPHYTDRLRAPAGITGWAQVHGLHGDTSIADRVKFDNQYIEYWSPWLDLVILARTLTSAVSGPPRRPPGPGGAHRPGSTAAGTSFASPARGGRR